MQRTPTLTLLIPLVLCTSCLNTHSQKCPPHLAQDLDLTPWGSPPMKFSSVQFSHSVVSDSLQSHRLQHARLRCPSPTPGACSNPVIDSCHRVGEAIQPSHPLLSPSPPAFNLSQHRGLFQSQFFASGDQSIGVSASASVLPVNIQD